MNGYDYLGNPIPQGKVILIGAVLDAGSDANRFKAMKQLLDIGVKKLQFPDAEIAADEFTYASKGAVALLPQEPAMHQLHTPVALYAKNADSKAEIASVTKVMSLVTGLDYAHDLEEVVAIKSADVRSGSGNYFSAGDTMTLREMMLAMMLPSSNTAAWAFARIVGAKVLEAQGDSAYTDTECVTAFIAAMNAKAANAIGMTNPNFVYPDGGVATMTPAELLRLIVEACSYPDICKVWGKKTYTIAVGGSNPRNVTLETTVTDAAIEAVYTILGGKTGSMTNAKALVMAAEVAV